MPNADPRNLGHPAIDEWARLREPVRDVTGTAQNRFEKGRRTFVKRGEQAAFVYPMGIKADTTWLEGGAGTRHVIPEKVFPPRNPSLPRASEQFGSFYHQPHAEALKRLQEVQITPTAPRFAPPAPDSEAAGCDVLGAVNLQAERRRVGKSRAMEAAAQAVLQSEGHGGRLFPGEQLGPLQRALLEPRQQKRQRQVRAPSPAGAAGISFTSSRHSIEALERFLTVMR
eukprot:7280970-Prymnesium_polylepis.2